MLSVKAIFDGKEIKLLEKIGSKKPGKVIVTFPDEDDPEIKNHEILYVAEKGGSFDFLNDPAEDIYTDKDLKVKYK
ncbi:MAG: hypothetical protein IPM38_03125 [Ignavibacteria bacterium]|nr:hypothetical protein [Ignavibacteria bacterium]